MQHEATAEQIEGVVTAIKAMGYEARPIPGAQRTAIGLLGNDGKVDSSRIEAQPGVAEVIHVSKPYKVVARDWRPDDTVIRLPNGTEIGGGKFVVMAGPCAVESAEQLNETAEGIAKAGATLLRGGAFKPRTSPYAFQGLGLEGLKLLRAAADKHNLAVVTEAIDETSLRQVAEWADIIQIGARNMQNFMLLRAAGQTRKPVLLKRGPSATIQEWLLAAEYIAAEGNEQIILCERGLRSFDTNTRNLLDVAAIPVVKQLSHLPVIIDPSHGTGRRDKVLPLARAGAAVGADGLMVEVHPKPENAMSDGPQSLTLPMFVDVMAEVAKVCDAVGIPLHPAVVRA
jgi:3-deoxy-7-phosphoheptulonate synthase